MNLDNILKEISDLELDLKNAEMALKEASNTGSTERVLELSAVHSSILYSIVKLQKCLIVEEQRVLRQLTQQVNKALDLCK